MKHDIDTLPECILVVDDQEDLRDGLRIDLESRGYEILTAANGQEGLKQLEQRGADIRLILCDEMMPVMPGFEFCRNVKANPAWWAIPLVFLTARTDQAEFLEGFLMGASDYIVKPYCEEKLFSIMKKRIADFQVLLEHRADELERARLTMIEQMARGVIHDMTGVLTDLGFEEVIRESLDQIRDFITNGRSSTRPILEVVNEIDLHCKSLKQAVDMGVNLLEGLQLLCHGQGEERSLEMLGDIVRIPLKLLDRALAIQGIAVECKLSEVLLECHKRDIIQVVLNLLRNAMQSMEWSSKKRISVSLYEENDQIILQVADAGSGIPPKDRPHIFKWGYTTKEKGKGVGMPTIKRIVEDHGGTIELESQVDRGTIFTISFPAYRESMQTAI